MNRISLLSSVALIEDVASQKLTKGQIGTVVEYLERGEEKALLVEFADSQGHTYAMVDLKPEQLIVLHREIEAA